MNCPNCKAEITNDMKFCIKCGTKIETPVSAPEEAAKIPVVKPEDKAAGIPRVKPAQEPAKAPEAKPAQEPAKVPEVKPAQETAGAETPAQNTVPAKPAFCIKCGAPLKEGTKFCTKCGTHVTTVPEGVRNAEVTQNSESAPVYSGVASLGGKPAAPADNFTDASDTVKKKHGGSKGLIIIIILVIAALIVAILLALKSMGVFSGAGRQETDTAQSDETEDTDENDEEEDEPEDEEDPEVTAARLAEIEEIEDQIKGFVKEGDESEGISDSYPSALDLYIKLAEEYDMAEDISKGASDVFDRYAAQVAHSVSLLDGQKVSSGLYIQSRAYYDEILEYAEKLEKAGIEIDASDVTEASDSLIDVYREKYILAINEIASRENWSRDEAWELAEDAASITDDDGNMVLFDPDDLDDPLRLRYAYSLAWVTRKRIETGIKDKTMTAEDALDEIDRVLKETDYNLQLIYDGIYYCSEAGIDPTPYTEAFNSIMEKLGENEGILIILDPAKATDTNIDLNHFWAFNDISSGADPDFQVSTTNGTTAETRAWIRDNIRIKR